jgi:hypothetical protein
MFRAPLCPSSGAHEDSVGYHIGRLVLELLLDGSLSAGRMDEFQDRRGGLCGNQRYRPDNGHNGARNMLRLT